MPEWTGIGGWQRHASGTVNGGLLFHSAHVTISGKTEDIARSR